MTDTLCEYDRLAHEHHWFPEALFGLCYEYIQPGQHVLDAGTGTGLAAEPFAKAGLQVHGFDLAAEALEICRQKGCAAELKQHDFQVFPWPYEALSFDHVISCGVLHFLPELEPVFAEIKRLLRPGGTFTFTTKAPQSTGDNQPFDVQVIQDTNLYLHHRAYLDQLMVENELTVLKEMRLLVTTGKGTEELFYVYVCKMYSEEVEAEVEEEQIDPDVVLIDPAEAEVDEGSDPVFTKALHPIFERGDGERYKQ